MAEYKLRFTDETQESDSRQETLDDLIDFMREMEGLTMTVVTLDDEQSENWDKDDKDDFDYRTITEERLFSKFKRRIQPRLVSSSAMPSNNPLPWLPNTLKIRAGVE